MEPAKHNFEERLQSAVRQWQSLRYTGKEPAFETQPARNSLVWAGAAVAAGILAIILWPSAPQWPEALRPVLRGSPFHATAPALPTQRVDFRFPGAPTRTSCFSQPDACEQPTG